MRVFANLKIAILTVASAVAFSLCGTNSALAVVQFEQNVTPEVIFGSGNSNGSFTTDRRNGLEIGLRGKLRFNGAGLPENTFNSNSNGTYNFQAIVGPTRTSPTPEWSFEWSINTDFEDPTSSGSKLNEFTYEIGLDGDPGPGTDFLTFDPINGLDPVGGVVCADHAIGDNSTGNGGGASVPIADCRSVVPGTQAAAVALYADRIANNNVAQNSWRYDFFLAGPLAGFDPTVPGNYVIYLLARNSSGEVVARSDIQILTGGADPIEPGGFDHFQCYNIDWSTKLDRRRVDLEDQFVDRENVKVSRKAKKYCTPVDKNGEGISNPDNNLTCYRIDKYKPKLKVKVENQFGTQTFKLKESRLLCVPSSQIEVLEANEDDDDDDDEDDD
ncbi:MAG: hypothetical protein NPINA01_09580 [Nitrospinaceae bacterium]|nr:MAG: hypothetical protein NPINA01_09580 [Nitrospinaceae bacterium]